MRRREFIAVLAVVAGATPTLYPAPAQTADLRRVGVIYQGRPLETSIEGLREGLKAAGLEDSWPPPARAYGQRRSFTHLKCSSGLRGLRATPPRKRPLAHSFGVDDSFQSCGAQGQLM